MIATSGLDTHFGTAWSAFEASLGVRRVRVSIVRVIYIRSDPLDGAWITCMAEVRLGGEDFHGFATGREISDDLRTRAVGEAVERAVWASGVANPAAPGLPAGDGSGAYAPAIRVGDSAGGIHLLSDAFTQPEVRTGRRVAAEPTTSGSAVHRTPERAVMAGAAEVLERIACIGGFHRRFLGTPVVLPPALADIVDTEACGWHDEATGLVAVAVIGPSTLPRLAMAASLTRPQATAADALQHCYSEIVQSRAWIRRRARRLERPRTADEIVDPATRAEYWCSCAFERVEHVVLEFRAPGGTLAVPPLPDVDDLYLVSAAEVTVDEEVPMWYARVVAPDYPYALHTSSSERRLFSSLSGSASYCPHPYV